MNKIYFLLIGLLCPKASVYAMQEKRDVAPIEATIVFYKWHTILVGSKDYHKVRQVLDEEISERDRLGYAVVSDVRSSSKLLNFPPYFPIKFFFDKDGSVILDSVSVRIKGGRVLNLKLAVRRKEKHSFSSEGAYLKNLMRFLIRQAPEYPIDNV